MFSPRHISSLRPIMRRSLCLSVAFIVVAFGFGPSLNGQRSPALGSLEHLSANHAQPIVLPNLPNFPVATHNLSLEPSTARHNSADQKEASVVREWRRTKQGWELKARWNALNPQWGPAPPAANVHPLVIGLMQALLSIAALLVFESSKRDDSYDLVTILKADLAAGR